MHVIGCDVGSQGVKARIVSAAGETVAEASSGYAIDYPRPTWAEQWPDVWLRAIEDAVRAVLASGGVRPSEIRAIGLAAQNDGVVAIDKGGAPLRPAILWLDRRAVAQCQQAEEAKGSLDTFGLTGLNLDPAHVGPKIRWIADNQPDVFERATHFLLPGSYISYHLTGELAVDYSNASSSLLMDLRRREWSPALCELFAVPESLLAPIRPSTEVLGTLRRDVAQSLGLTDDTLVMVGGGDEHVAALGAGVLRPGLVLDVAGTAEAVGLASEDLVFDPGRLVESHCHAHPDLWLIEHPGFVSGANYRWFRDQFAPAEIAAARDHETSAYELLDEGAARIAPGSDGLLMLPCLMGAATPTWNASIRGTFLGFTLAHTREHFIRAILEASAYAVRDIIDQMRSMGCELTEIRVVGGGARSRLWRQIKADVVGLPVVNPLTPETTSLGAAMIALVGIGAFASLEEAADTMVEIDECLVPDPSNRAAYEEAYASYREAYFALVPVFERAVSGRRKAG